METGDSYAKEHYDKYINDNKLPGDILETIRIQAQTIGGNARARSGHAAGSKSSVSKSTHGSRGWRFASHSRRSWSARISVFNPAGQANHDHSAQNPTRTGSGCSSTPNSFRTPA